MVTRMGHFDGIDINMGCPVKKIIKGGGCSALILDPPRAKEIIRATRAATHLPVSVKTRIGFHHTETESWMEHLLETEPAAIILHARTSKEQSLVPARWEEISRAVEVRDRSGLTIPLIGNGDVTDPEDGMAKCQEFGADGFMIGRGIFHQPWMYDGPGSLPDITLRLEALLEHARLYTATWEDGKPFQMLKRFFKIYINAFPGAGGLRARLMETHSLEEAEEVIRGFSTNQGTEEMTD
jgi:tRNA-dihydrouridine synthase